MLTAGALVAKLQEDLTRKAYSFAEHIRVTSPYIAPGQEPLYELIARQAGEERGFADNIARLIVTLGGVPTPGLFDEGGADTNYLKITYLGAELVTKRERAVRTAEERVEDCAGHPAAREVMLAVLDVEQRHLRELREELARHEAKAASKPAAQESGTAPPESRADSGDGQQSASSADSAKT